MKPIGVSVALGAVLVTLAAPPVYAQSPVFIEYSVTGGATASGRDADVVMCSSSPSGLIINTMGRWVFWFETPSAAPGERDATVRVSAPDSVRALHDNNVRTDDRLRGTAKLVVASAGRGQGGVPLLRVRFTASGLRSETGATISVTGSLVCPVL